MNLPFTIEERDGEQVKVYDDGTVSPCVGEESLLYDVCQDLAAELQRVALEGTGRKRRRKAS